MTRRAVALFLVTWVSLYIVIRDIDDHPVELAVTLVAALVVALVTRRFMESR